MIAVDSTGLSLITSDSWNRHKHHLKPRGNASWHKLHVAIDTETGDILTCEDTPATTNDCEVLPTLMEAMPTQDIGACEQLSSFGLQTLYFLWSAPQIHLCILRCDPRN